MLDDVADGFHSFGTSMGSTVSPLGPTAYEMGAFVEFFKGLRPEGGSGPP